MTMSDVEKARTQVGASDPAAALAAKRIRLAPYNTMIGPVTHLHEERKRLAGLSFDHIEVIQRGATLGAEIRGVDICRPVAPEVVADIRKALNNFKVIYFRNQPLTASQHVAFAREFGDLETHPFITGNSEHPELVRFDKGEDSAGFENGWHHDVTWREIPSMGAILHALKVPPTGGDTLFADMAAAYDGLSDEMKERVDALTATHDFMLAFGGQVPDDQKPAMREAYPIAHHPVIRTHPETGRKLIFVNRYFTSGIEGLEPAESVELIRELTDQANTLEYQFRFNWEADSVVFWDNRCVQHYAASDYWPEARIVERASVVGDVPF